MFFFLTFFVFSFYLLIVFDEQQTFGSVSYFLPLSVVHVVFFCVYRLISLRRVLHSCYCDVVFVWSFLVIQYFFIVSVQFSLPFLFLKPSLSFCVFLRRFCRKARRLCWCGACEVLRVFRRGCFDVPFFESKRMNTPIAVVSSALQILCLHILWVTVTRAPMRHVCFGVFLLFWSSPSLSFFVSVLFFSLFSN